ncbi:MAG: hypothetical protein PHC61_14005, partial [Chitinivibrionales bacterium]|nr:hypothetical protein [Chitinivibrionales bacterium]
AASQAPVPIAAAPTPVPAAADSAWHNLGGQDKPPVVPPPAPVQDNGAPSHETIRPKAVPHVKNRTGNEPIKPKQAAVEKSALLTPEMLYTKYGTRDPVQIADGALAAGSFAQAAFALDLIPDNGPDYTSKVVLQLAVMLQSSQFAKAKAFIAAHQVNDARFDLYAGRVNQLSGDDAAALNYFQTALTKPNSTGNRGDIRKDALYYTALSYANQYKKNPSPEMRAMVMQGWRVVKNAYSGMPGHARYLQAVTELSSVQ